MMTDTSGTERRLPIDTGRDDALRHVRYEDLLRAVGGYIDQHGFTDVLISQLPDGVILKGTVIDRTQRSANERIVAVFFSNEDITELLAASMRRRRPPAAGTPQTEQRRT